MNARLDKSKVEIIDKLDDTWKTASEIGVKPATLVGLVKLKLIQRRFVSQKENLDDMVEYRLLHH